MTTRWIWLLAVLFLVGIVNAAPSTGAATAITSNGFNATVTGTDGGNAWIAFGTASGSNNWASSYIVGDGEVVVYGAPIIGGSTIYYKGCDSTGCDNTEQTLTIAAITPLPTTTLSAVYDSLSNTHFRITDIPGALVNIYSQTQVSITIFAGVAFFFLFFGFWFRTRSVRLSLIMGLLMAVFIITPTAGLMLGAPLAFQMVAQGLMAAAIAGVLLMFVRK